MKNTLIVLATVVSFALTHQARAATATVSVNGHSAGPTPFISQVDLTIAPAASLKKVTFTIQPKTGSGTRAVSAAYSSAYLQRRGFLDLQTGHLTLPVFGLYAGYSNTVTLAFQFQGGSPKPTTLVIPTAPFVDSSGTYTNPTILQARAASSKLSYDFILLKGSVIPMSPIILDTDAEVRWVGTADTASQPAIFFENGIYISSGSGLTRMELDGAHEVIADYAAQGVTGTGHHNYDLGKFGMLLEVDTTNWVESVVIEVDVSGNLLKSWSLGDILNTAMVNGGDEPSAFVRHPDDWFHNNACTYRRSDDTLIVSSRENFVIGLDYETGAIRWILGDTTKAWYQYPSLRKFAITVGAGSLEPIGQHAVSITKDNSLLLFDNGAASLGHVPAGLTRDYSAPRKYRLNAKKLTATETWHYQPDPSVSSPYCSSIYEDKPRNYLVDYSLAGPFLYTEVLGIDSKGTKVFNFRYPAINCSVGWNAIPVHLENLNFP